MKCKMVSYLRLRFIDLFITLWKRIYILLKQSTHQEFELHLTREEKFQNPLEKGKCGIIISNKSYFQK